VRGVGVIAVALVLGTSALLLVAGAGGDRVSAADAPAADDKLKLGVVAIDARIGDERVESSGTVVDPRAGLVVTSAHTVWGATSLRLSTGLGILHGRVVARAPCADLAVIEIQPRLPGLVAPKPAGYTPQATELLSAVGRRADALLTIPIRAAGAANAAAVEPGMPKLDEAIRLDTAVVPESSGGALVDGRGQVVGMTMATTRGGALAVPWSTIEARLRELRVDDRRIYVGWRSYYRCAPQLHAYARREHAGYDPKDAVINAPVPATRLPGTEQLDRQ
jgi:S1-C subfamily serine protease